jgi:predicted aspartyl protease
LICLLMTCVALFGTYPTAAQPESPRASSADALGHALTKLGYTGISLERMRTGHLVASVRIEGQAGKHDLRLVIDNGSGVTLLTPDAAKALGLSVDKTNGFAGGLGGGGIAVSTTRAKAFKVGSHEEKDVSLLVIDIAHVNAGFKGAGERAVDGVIGSDWMLAKKTLLDIESARLFILAPKAK